MDATPGAGRGRRRSEAVATVVCSAGALLHVERALGQLRDEDPARAVAAARAISSGFDALAAHPLLGRRLEGELRELVISCGGSGFVALYRYLVATDEARVLALRSQREIGFAP